MGGAPASYNHPGFTLFDHRVVALASERDMMEGISAEAASLAGHLRRSSLCWIYDCNRISIEDATAITFTKDVGARFQAHGWRVPEVTEPMTSNASRTACGYPSRRKRSQR